MLIGINGVMGSGKSEAIKVLMQYIAAGKARPIVTLVKFAQPLYDIQEMVYARIQSAYKRPLNFTKDRKLLQWIGTEWGRDSISPTLWVDLWKAKVQELRARHGEDTIIVCDDVRFENEALAVKELGGVILQIRTTQNHTRIDTTAGFANHVSEAGFDSALVDHVIDNDASLHQYQTQLVELYEKLGVKR